MAGGEGRITWKPLEIQRFSEDYTTIDVIDFVGRSAGYSKAEWDKAQSVLSGGKSTNLTRLMESAGAQSHLGITVQTEQTDTSRKIPVLGADPNWALQVLKRIVDDILRNRVNSRTLNTTTDIEKYFSGLPPELQPGPDTAAATPKPFRDIALPGSQAKPPQKPPAKTKPGASNAKDARSEEAPLRRQPSLRNWVCYSRKPVHWTSASSLFRAPLSSVRSSNWR